MDRTIFKIEPTIETVAERKLIGKRSTMSLANDRTGELWRSFMPQLKEVQNKVGTVLYSMQVYRPSHFDTFMPGNEFEKWAAVEVSNFTDIPKGMETYTIPQGLYAVFNYRGPSTDSSIFQYIFSSWLPSSAYVLDNRPHFEVLGEKYKNGDPESEEDIYIPIRPKDCAST